MGITGLLFWSALILVPAVIIVINASRFLAPHNRLTRLAPLAVVIGFLAGGIVGWIAVPAEWTASFWTTVEAAGNSVKYGETFEHTAERVLMYFLYSGLLGEVVFGVTALMIVWRAAERPLENV
jgi:hypothetical protein